MAPVCSNPDEGSLYESRVPWPGWVIKSMEDATELIAEVGYPLRQTGQCGAANTYKIKNEEGLLRLFATKPNTEYIMRSSMGDPYLTVW